MILSGTAVGRAEAPLGAAGGLSQLLSSLTHSIHVRRLPGRIVRPAHIEHVVDECTVPVPSTLLVMGRI